MHMMLQKIQCRVWCVSYLLQPSSSIPTRPAAIGCFPEYFCDIYEVWDDVVSEYYRPVPCLCSGIPTCKFGHPVTGRIWHQCKFASASGQVGATAGNPHLFIFETAGNLLHWIMKHPIFDNIREQVLCFFSCNRVVFCCGDQVSPLVLSTVQPCPSLISRYWNMSRLHVQWESYTQGMELEGPASHWVNEQMWVGVIHCSCLSQLVIHNFWRRCMAFLCFYLR